MKGLVCYIIAIVAFLTFFTVMLVKSNRRLKSNVLKPVNYLMIGTFVASFFLFIPVYANFFGVEKISFQTIILSIHNSIRLFVVDADFESITSFTALVDGAYGTAYEVFFAVLYVLAPILTFSFVLSLFNNISAYIRLLFSRYKDLYVFSDLNERSLTLAKDITGKNKNAVIVFTDVSTGKDEDNDLLEDANELGAIIFKKSVSSINYNVHSKSKKTVFFVISPNEEENVSQSSELIERYKNRKNSELYLFSMTKQSELFLESLSSKHVMKIRRIRESASLVNRYLYDNGRLIFESAHKEEDGLKVISTVVIGMGAYGMEMAKALPWFCQLSGYRFKLNAFDKDKYAESKFTALCPEYMNPSCNRVYVDGEAQYDITVHTEFDYKLAEFGEKLSKIPDASFVFIALGSDEENISCAITCRMYFERMGIHPRIVTVVYDGDKIKRIKDAKEIDKRSFDIDYTGSLEEMYSVNVIINSELEEKALKVHMQYPAPDKTLEEHEEGFWTNEYNYNSSCASAIHNKVRVECKISGADKDEKDLTPEEKDIITVIEHRRWNAYVRSCGYVYSKSKEKSSRNDLAKLHNCLVPFDELTDEYKKIDTDIAVKK